MKNVHQLYFILKFIWTPPHGLRRAFFSSLVIVLHDFFAQVSSYALTFYTAPALASKSHG